MGVVAVRVGVNSPNCMYMYVETYQNNLKGAMLQKSVQTLPVVYLVECLTVWGQQGKMPVTGTGEGNEAPTLP